jgi:hypothetical protein
MAFPHQNLLDVGLISFSLILPPAAVSCLGISLTLHDNGFMTRKTKEGVYLSIVSVEGSWSMIEGVANQVIILQCWTIPQSPQH